MALRKTMPVGELRDRNEASKAAAAARRDQTPQQPPKKRPN
ncbi:hypothetical protein [Streptomyces sp. NPDC096153]